MLTLTFLVQVLLLTIVLMIPGNAECDEGLTLPKRDVFVGGEDGYAAYRIPAMIVTDKGTILAFCEGRRNGPADDGDIDLLVKRSLDGGATWSPQIVVYEEAGDITIGNPCPIFDPTDNTIHLLFTRDNKRLFTTKSIDDGLTWSEPEERSEILKEIDYPVVRIATGPVHGLIMSNGRFIAPFWISDRERKQQRTDQTQQRYQSGVFYSDDRGKTWRASELVPPDLNQMNECTVIERKDGSLLMNLRGRLLGHRAVSVAENALTGHISWSSPVLDENLPCPTCQASMIRWSEGEVLFSNPAVMSQDGKIANFRKELTMRLSLDEGKTWAYSRMLEPGFAGYSDVTIRPDGVALCIYECGEEIYNEKISIAGFTREWVTGGK